MMEQHPVENGPLRMSRAIDSRHGGRKASRTGPGSWIGPPVSRMRCRGRPGSRKPDGNRQPALTLDPQKGANRSQNEEFERPYVLLHELHERKRMAAGCKRSSFVSISNSICSEDYGANCKVNDIDCKK
jgi:hypothetical protein